MIQCRMGAEDAEIRRENFKQWCGTPFSPSRVAERLGFNTAAFWSDLYHGRKAFGEKLAREVERAANLVRMSLDDPDGPIELPFSQDLMTALMKVPGEERLRFEKMLRAAVGLEQEARTTPPVVAPPPSSGVVKKFPPSAEVGPSDTSRLVKTQEQKRRSRTTFGAKTKKG